MVWLLGNTLEEALCSGILEVVERDAYADFERAPRDLQETAAVDLATITDPLIQKLLLQCEAADTSVVFYDLTDRWGIPTFACALHDRDFTRRSNHFMGTAAHYTKQVAMIRAITEAAQVRLTYITGSRDDVLRDSILICKHPVQRCVAKKIMQSFLN